MGNIKLASVVSDITGVSARAMLQALVGGQTDVVALAELAKGRLRSKQAELEQALRGTLLEHHAFMISQHLALLDVFDEQIAAFDERIQAAIEGTRPRPPTDEGSGPADGLASPEGASAPSGSWAAQAILDAIPGIGLRIARRLWLSWGPI